MSMHTWHLSGCHLLSATSEVVKLSFGWGWGRWGRGLIWSLVSVNRYSSLKSFCVSFCMDLCLCMHPYSWVHGCTFKIRYLKLRGFSCSVHSLMSSYSRNMLYSVRRKWDFEWKVWKSELKPWGEDWNLRAIGTSFLMQAILALGALCQFCPIAHPPLMPYVGSCLYRETLSI